MTTFLELLTKAKPLFSVKRHRAAVLGLSLSTFSLGLHAQMDEFSPKVMDLLGKMTFEEKVEELTQDAPANKRLGIPFMKFGECLHGLKADGATYFPQAIALASAWDPKMLQEVASAVAREARSAGVTHCYTPVLDVIRDPRYGRVEESYAEDPYLVTRMGVAFINGLQGVGKERFDQNHILATAKHFAGYSEPHRGINGAYVDVSKRTMWEIFLPPFEAAVKEAGVASLMPGHQDLNGIPAHMNHWLLRDILRERWGFKGFIVSDNNDISRLQTMHRIAETREDAAILGLKAGVDMDLVLGKPPEFYTYDTKTLKKALAKDPSVERYMDESVARILQAKLNLGLFDKPQAQKPAKSLKAHQKLALESAKQSIILLKNENNFLPLERNKYKSIAVIGPNAHADNDFEKRTLVGGYSLEPAYFVSIYDGLKKALGKNVRVTYAEGAKVNSDSRIGFGAAIKAAKNADLVILAMGGSTVTGAEGKDRDSIKFPGAQEELMRKIHALGKPTAMILINSRPLDLSWVDKNIPAVLETWYPGIEGGNAVASILFGDHNPSGKLTVSFPRHIGQLPVSYLIKPDFIGAGKGQYVGQPPKTALYPFGHGLSYTTFAYSNARVKNSEIKPNGSTTLSVSVKNTGSMTGEEVVQLYVRDEYASVGRYIKMLKGFDKISLKPGESKQVEFKVGFDELALLDKDFKKVVEPGDFTLLVGPSSKDEALTPVKLKVIE